MLVSNSERNFSLSLLKHCNRPYIYSNAIHFDIFSYIIYKKGVGKYILFKRKMYYYIYEWVVKLKKKHSPVVMLKNICKTRANKYNKKAEMAAVEFQRKRLRNIYTIRTYNISIEGCADDRKKKYPRGRFVCTW